MSRDKRLSGHLYTSRDPAAPLPRLIVTVDTEEEGLWGGRFRRTGNTVENIRGISRFQALCDNYGIRPTYLVDAAVVESGQAVDLLRPIQDDGRCEIGAHVHPWCNPPFVEEITERNSFLCNLPDALQRQKIEWLTEAIERRFDRRPTSFRAGRYGLKATGARILAELGYIVDSSVIPFTNYSGQGGPNFGSAPCEPYFPDEIDLAKPALAGTLLEIPVSVGFNRLNFQRAHAIREIARTPALRWLRIAGILDRLRLVRRIKLSPEQADAEQMQQLIDVSLRRGARCLVMMFHSSSLVAQQSPYVPDNNALEQFFSRLVAVFDHCSIRHQISSTTLSGAAQEYRQFLNATEAVSAEVPLEVARS